MNQGATQGQFLLHTTRESPGTAVLEAFYLSVNLFYVVVPLGDGGAEESGKEA